MLDLFRLTLLSYVVTFFVLVDWFSFLSLPLKLSAACDFVGFKEPRLALSIDYGSPLESATPVSAGPKPSSTLELMWSSRLFSRTRWLFAWCKLA